jgi:hypothetical protein
LDTLYWPMAHVEQFVQAVAPASENCPAAQAVQALAGATANVPAGQDVQALAPRGANQPDKHVVQLLDPAGAARPIPQSSQVLAPRVFSGKENLPAVQTSQVVFLPNSLEAVPSWQSSQSRSIVLEQVLHPGNRLYLPAEHRMHGPPAGPHRPLMHEQFRRSQASGGENVPSGHVASSPE